MDGLPIGDYALLSDCRSAALVSRAGSVDWLCFPRFDAPSVFCRLLDPAGGRFAIRPAGDFRASRVYLDQTMVLETTFRAEAGTAVLTDALAVGRNDRGHHLGAGSPGVLLRRLECMDGEVEIDVTYAPRPEYGLIHPILETVPGGLAARGGAGRLLLSGPVSFRIDGATATVRLQLIAGQTVMFALLGAAQRLVDQLGELDPVTRRFLAAAADTAASRWKEKDQGIWEIRGEPRDFVYSKLMCWVALDRAIALAPQLGAGDRDPGWAAARDEIRAAILDRGWSEKAGAFTQAFGGDDLDASNLMLAITGFLPGDDPRMKATIDATATRLTDKRGLVYRYLAHDGLAGEEGTFLLCTFWLAQAQALAGELGPATATFERAVAAINDVGLLAEEVDAGSGEMIGNFPQAFSHIGLINAAWAITQAQQRAASDAISAVPAGSGEAQRYGS